MRWLGIACAATIVLACACRSATAAGTDFASFNCGDLIEKFDTGEGSTLGRIFIGVQAGAMLSMLLMAENMSPDIQDPGFERALAAIAGVAKASPAEFKHRTLAECMANRSLMVVEAMDKAVMPRDEPKSDPK